MIVESLKSPNSQDGKSLGGFDFDRKMRYVLVTSVVAGISLRHYSDKINHLGYLVVIETIKS